MIYKLFIVIYFVIYAAFARDGVYLEQNIQSSGINLPQPVNSITKFWISENKVRIEQAGQVLLIDFTGEKILTLISESNEFIEITFKEMESLLALGNMFMQSPDSSFLFKRTGISKKIKNWNAYQIESKSENLSFKIWLSEEISLDRSLVIKMYTKMPGMSNLVSALEKSINYKGFPVFMETEMLIMNTMVKTQVELIKAEKQKMDDSLFIIPENFKKIENPMKILQNK